MKNNFRIEVREEKFNTIAIGNKKKSFYKQKMKFSFIKLMTDKHNCYDHMSFISLLFLEIHFLLLRKNIKTAD